MKTLEKQKYAMYFDAENTILKSKGSFTSRAYKFFKQKDDTTARAAYQKAGRCWDGDW